MSQRSPQSQSRVAKIWLKLKQALVSDVPIELDACEVCRKTECSHGHWTECENRINHAKRLEQDRANNT